MPRSRALVLLALLTPLLAAGLQAQRTVNLNGEAIRKGPWKNGYKIPKGWVRIRTAHYEVQSQAGREKAKRLGKHMESMLRVYVKCFRPDKTLSSKKYTIKLLKNRGAYRAYGAPPGTGAYYSPMESEMVCYDTGKWYDAAEPKAAATGAKDDPLAAARAAADLYKMDILGAASHEGWHQYFHWYVGSWVPIPSWINEGMGDYFYTARPIKKNGRLSAELGRMNETRLPVIQWAVRNNKHVPIQKILSYDQRQYYSNPAICYAEGWALCQFLLHSGNKKYARLVGRFARTVANDSNMPAVTKKVFRGIDFEELEKEWKAWVLEQKLEEKAKPAAGAAKKKDRKRS